MASYYFLLKARDAGSVEQLQILFNTTNVSKYKQILRNECTGKENLFIMLSPYIVKPFTALFALRYRSFVGSSCTPAVCVVASIKIMEGTHKHTAMWRRSFSY